MESLEEIKNRLALRDDVRFESDGELFHFFAEETVRLAGVFLVDEHECPFEFFYKSAMLPERVFGKSDMIYDLRVTTLESLEDQYQKNLLFELKEMKEFDGLMKLVKESDVVGRLCACVVDEAPEDVEAISLLHYLEIHPEDVCALFVSLAEKHADNEEQLKIVKLVQKDLEDYENKFEMHFKRLKLLKAILER